jgi:hypothetical protein
MARHPDLADARESLEYWQRRERALPRRQRAQRREAREHAARWQQRVARAERETYGAGPLGALLQLVSEGRAPEPLRQTGRTVARHGRHALIAVAAMAAAFTVMTLAVCCAILVALF